MTDEKQQRQQNSQLAPGRFWNLSSAIRRTKKAARADKLEAAFRGQTPHNDSLTDLGFLRRALSSATARLSRIAAFFALSAIIVLVRPSIGRAAITIGDGERMTNSNPPVTSPPFTMAVRIKRSGGSGTARSAFGLCANAGVFNHSFTLAHGSAGFGAGLARARTTSTAQASGQVLSDLSTGNWTTLAGVFVSSASRYCYANGCAGSENTTSASPAVIASSRINWQPPTRPIDKQNAARI